LTDLQPDTDGRLASLRPLVVGTVGDRPLEAALRDISRGDGNELLWTRGGKGLRPPSLHSIYSSCGLALNAFGPWRTAPESLALLGASGYTSLRFEGKRSIFRGGRPPNLDLVISDDSRVIAIESKLLEHLTGGQLAAFKPAYERAIRKADATWRLVYEKLKKAPNAFNYLDAAQLIRHYLGLKAQVGTGGQHGGKEATLVYLYWEPSNAGDLQACRTHAEEVAAFTSAVNDPGLRFEAMKYSTLWAEWLASPKPSWLDHHVSLLVQRYELAL